MKDFLKKYSRIGLVALLAISFTTNCPGKDDDDDNLLLLGAYLLLNQPQYAVSIVGELKTKSNGAWTLASFSGANDNERRYYSARQMNLGSEQLILADGEVVRQITSGADAQGKFSLSFKMRSLNANIAITGLGLPDSVLTNLAINSFGNSVEGDKPENYTASKGSFSFSLTGNLADPSNLNQISGKVVNSDDFNADITQITVTQIGVYNLPNPTVGEQVCDGARVTGSPTVKSGTINAAETWSGAILLQGTVTANAAITVQPGTVIFGQRGSSLFVLGANKLTAIGTAADPICWTSASSPGSRFPGDWGGIVTVGNSGASRTATTEGTTPQNYGGVPSGNTLNVEMEYNIIEFGGNEVAPGDELNNISMYASNTKLTNVQAHRGLDDQFEAWGGQLAWNRMLATGGLDDDYDLDEGVTGTISNAIGHKYPASCGGSASTDPHGLEWDGIHSNGTPACNTSSTGGCTTITLNKFTLIGANITSGQAGRLRERVVATLTNGVNYGYSAGFNARNTGTAVTVTNVKTDKANTDDGSATIQAATVDLNALPIVSDGGISTDCGFGEANPDYTLTSAASGALGATDGVGKFWENWAVFRAR
ncbi:hypothetical protein [Leptospira sp. GIMC2001]|uniref:hypothetical protein n=1 Tax=Leptospira sp. GIMC2001 TaxID=1513297 RepID=UPI00234BB9EA|nr:hypothetical protein [Leptospira sp. GIMC2001]WCL49260.1 hypothetical protein O4O04_18500 [Leptospira sp. GIMC2001]